MFSFGKTKKLESQLAALSQEIAQLKNSAPDWAGLTGDQWSEFFSMPVASGVTVTSESAKRSSAVYACVRLLAGSVSLLPLPIYQRNESGRQRVNHDLWWLLNESPYPTLTACSFWEWMVSSALLREDGLAQIMRDKNGVPKNLMPLPRECVTVKKVDSSLVYLVNDGISKYGLHQDDVLHFPGFGFNGVHGESVIKYAARQAIGTAIAADEYSGEFFANGATPSVVIEYPEKILPTEQQQEYLRTQFNERHTGKGNRHKPLLLVNGGKLSTVSLTAEDAQLLETRKFQVIEIARAFGVPPHMIGETSASTSWGSGIEQMSIGYVRYTLGPHLTRIEQELNRKLWPRSGKYFVEFNRDGLLSGDSKTEAEVFGKALGGPGAQGWMSINEVRRIKNLPPLEGQQFDQVQIASQHLTQGNTNENPPASA